MKMFKEIVVLLLAIISISAQTDEGELVFLNVIFRHGARTTTEFYPNDPNKDTSFYPLRKGDLTMAGRMGEYKLGQYLRELYGDFAGPDYFPKLIKMRSVEMDRTLMSAQLVLAGFFPPSPDLTWNTELNWQPIPVSYTPISQEDMFHPSRCDYKSEAVKDLPNIPEVQEKYIKPYEELYNYIEENSGKSMKIPKNMQDFYFILKCESNMNMIMPEWTKIIFPSIVEESASHVYSYLNYFTEVKRINSGYMLKEILDNANKTISGDSKRKINFWSGQETTIGFMLNNLKASKPTVPGFSSALIFEFRKIQNDYFIKLKYKPSEDIDEMIDLNIEGCDILCPYDKFIQLVDYVIPKVSLSEACSKPYNRTEALMNLTN